MIPIQSIRLRRAEGPSAEPLKEVVVKTFSAADAILRIWARTAPEDGSYHKCDFMLEWTDGAVYAGRHDLVRKDARTADILARHTRLVLEWQAVRSQNPRMPESDYQDYLAQIEARSPGRIAAAAQLLDQYQIGDAEAALIEQP